MTFSCKAFGVRRLLTMVCLAVSAQLPAQGQNGLPSDAVMVIDGESGSRQVTGEEIDKLSRSSQQISRKTPQGEKVESWTGPLLWTVLTAERAIDANKHKDHVRMTLVIKGRDGYAARLAVAEISPDFAGKPVILAIETSKAAPAGYHFRLIVPGESRAGRSVRDVVSITVEHAKD